MSADFNGPTVVLNLDAVLTAAASVGLVGEQALVEHLGVPLSPVTMRLLAKIVTRLPLALGAAAHVEGLP
jgi:hypothetical protein